jgi:putative DNA methylase
MTAVAERHEGSAASPAPRTFLERSFPFAQVSEIARRDRYSNDKTYAVHKWWARRPPAVIRALLLAAVLPPETSLDQFWDAFADSRDALRGKVVGDPFMGGATSLVEAYRLGADITGIDVDPLAVRTARVELQALDVDSFSNEAEAMLADLRADLSHLYPRGAGEPLHYFRLREATCSGCRTTVLVYRNLWLVRDRGLSGAVVRDEGGVAFCPLCQELHRIDSDRRVIDCCGHRHRLDVGTYSRGRFECPDCGQSASNEELQVGLLSSRLIAVEETVDSHYRALRKPSDIDLSALAEAEDSVCDCEPLEVALGAVDSGRPASYGYRTVADLFLPRQKKVLTAAFAWIEGRDLNPSTRDALRLAVSNALGSNNALCGYATDYGRLSSLFSAVRAYSVPVLSVELNPLHKNAGRGTLRATLRRVARSGEPTVTRHTINKEDGRPVRHMFAAHGHGRRAIRCSSADRALPSDLGSYDLVLTDPPYFDFIPYSDLSLIYRAWLAPESEAEKLGGKPIFPVGDDPSGEFATRLSRAFRNVGNALKPQAPMIFTFHSPHQEAWDAVELALRRADFRVHAAFPVWADGRGGSHGHAGNCEWDLVFVCRQGVDVAHSIEVKAQQWATRLEDQNLEAADHRNISLGLAMAGRLSS